MCMQITQIIYHNIVLINTHPGADPEGVRGVRTNPPGDLRLHVHIVCAYLAWSSNDFWPAEPLPDENTS